MANIFLTGASGYIGGQVLLDLARRYADLNVTCLMRSEEKACLLRQAFSQISTVIGDLDDTKILEEYAKESDIILHLAATGHIESTIALCKGLNRRTGHLKGHFIQIGGASVLAKEQIETRMFGGPSEKRYNDFTGLEEVRRLVKSSPDRAVDNYLIFGVPASVKSALVIGPLIYGQGEGLFNKRSMQAETVVEQTLEKRAGISIDDGQHQWSNVYIKDISDLIVRLVGSSLGREYPEATWNGDGVYFAENGEMTFEKLCTLTAQSAFDQGIIQSPQVKYTLHAEELDQVMHRGLALLGTNARCEAQRARRLLGWDPCGPCLGDTIPDIIKAESARLRNRQ